MVFPARTMRRVMARGVFCAILAGLTACTIVHHGSGGTAENASAQKAAANEEFDAKAYVKANWAAKVEPEVVRDAVEVGEVVKALKQDQAAADKKYGRRKDETALFNFVVKGKGAIKAVKTESAAGVMELDLPDSAGGNVQVQIGPVIKSSAIRDSLSFINFGDFVNQLDFANISKELNFYVRDNVVGGLKKDGLVGKHLEFVGAFAEDATGKVLITPVKLSVEP